MQWSAPAWAACSTLYSISCVQSSLSTGYSDICSIWHHKFFKGGNFCLNSFSPTINCAIAQWWRCGYSWHLGASINEWVGEWSPIKGEEWNKISWFVTVTRGEGVKKSENFADVIYGSQCVNECCFRQIFVRTIRPTIRPKQICQKWQVFVIRPKHLIFGFYLIFGRKYHLLSRNRSHVNKYPSTISYFWPVIR